MSAGRDQARSAGEKSYVLIDFENVQSRNVNLLVGSDYHVLVFVGTNQRKVSIELAEAMQNLGQNGEYVRITGAGRNALDFHIAYYLGVLAQQAKGAAFYVISRDTGFDPLVQHLKSKRIRAARYRDIEEIPALGMESVTNVDQRIEGIVRNLVDRGPSRPRKLTTLSNTINSLFANGLDDGEVAELVSELTRRGHLSVDEGRVTYHFARSSNRSRGRRRSGSGRGGGQGGGQGGEAKQSSSNGSESGADASGPPTNHPAGE